jgi:hypothetical protein
MAWAAAAASLLATHRLGAVCSHFDQVADDISLSKGQRVHERRVTVGVGLVKFETQAFVELLHPVPRGARQDDGCRDAAFTPERARGDELQ